MPEKKKHIVITCILCPYGCQLQVEKVNNEFRISGNRCKQGNEYALNELFNPVRTLTTTVKTIFPDFPRLAVKTNKEIRLQDIFDCMKEINSIIINKRFIPGEIVVSGLLKSDINLVATDNMLIYLEILKTI